MAGRRSLADIDATLRRLGRRIDDLRAKKDEVAASACPFKPGDILRPKGRRSPRYVVLQIQATRFLCRGRYKVQVRRFVGRKLSETWGYIFRTERYVKVGREKRKSIGGKLTWIAER
jgi:hypothetical protein